MELNVIYVKPDGTTDPMWTGDVPDGSTVYTEDIEQEETSFAKDGSVQLDKANEPKTVKKVVGMQISVTAPADKVVS